MHAQSAMIENGFVRVLDTALWLAPYLQELTIFPHRKHDDQVPPDTSFRERPRSYSTGTSKAAAPTRGSSNFTGSSTRKRWVSRPRVTVGCVCAPLSASAIRTCSN